MTAGLVRAAAQRAERTGLDWIAFQRYRTRPGREYARALKAWGACDGAIEAIVADTVACAFAVLAGGVPRQVLRVPTYSPAYTRTHGANRVRLEPACTQRAEQCERLARALGVEKRLQHRLVQLHAHDSFPLHRLRRAQSHLQMWPGVSPILALLPRKRFALHWRRQSRLHRPLQFTVGLHLPACLARAAHTRRACAGTAAAPHRRCR